MKKIRVFFRSGLFHNLVVFMLLTFLMLFCDKDNPTPEGPDPDIDNPVDLTVSPGSGIPGSSALISGLTGSQDSIDNYTIYIGDEPTAFMVQSDGSFRIFYPLFLDSKDYPSPPDTPQNLKLYKDSVLIGESVSPVTVLPLPKAPGTTQKTVDALENITSSYEAMLNAIPILDSTEIPVREALIGTMKALISEGENSLAALVSGNSAYIDSSGYNIDLLDALMASTGLLEAYEKLSEHMFVLQDTSLVASRSSNGGVTLCVGTGRDELLACGLQIYVMLQDWNDQVLNETVGSWSTLVDLPLSIVGISGRAVPHIAATTAILNILQFFMDKSISGLFPSHVTEFKLVMLNDSIGIDEYTQSAILVSAENTPVAIEVSDLIKLLSAFNPLRSGNNELFQFFGQYLGAAAEYVMNVYASLIEEYEANNPGSDADGDLFYSPNFYYGPFEVQNNNLVKLMSSDETIAIGVEDQLEWIGLDFGTVSVHAKGRGNGERSKMVYDNNLCLGCVYYGSAFGQSDPVSESKQVHVGRYGSLEVIIEGLPENISGDVDVFYPDGGKRHVTKTETLTHLKPGDYDIQAYEVSGPYDTYILENSNWTITVEEESKASVTVTYEEEFGNLLLTVTNLPEGVDADIEITGPNFSHYQIYGDTLLDSLSKGEYTITANNVLDNDGKSYKPDPENQNVTINSGETSIANVTYNPPVKMSVYYGADLYHLEGEYPDKTLPVTYAESGSSDGYIYNDDQIFVPDLTLNKDCILEGGNNLGSDGAFSSSVSSSSGTASADVSFSISYGSYNEITVNASCNAVAAAPTPPDKTPFSSYGANAAAGTTQIDKLVIEVENGGLKNLAFIINYSGTVSRDGDLGATYGAHFKSNLYFLTYFDYCPNSMVNDIFFLDSYSSTEFNGTDTISLNHSPLEHFAFGVEILGSAGAITYTDEKGEISDQRSGQASATLQMTIRLVELQE